MTDEDATPFLTVPEIARHLGVSETTAHNWRKAYRELIPSSVGRDGYQRYSVRRYEEIASLRSQQLPVAAIRAALLQRRVEQPSRPPAESFEAAVLARLDRLIELAERIADRLAPPRESA